MSILIGAARHDENGNIGGGKKGDQTGHEVEAYPWTDRPGDGWNILRYKDPALRARAVEMAWEIINNPNVGYSQWTHGSLEKAGRAVNWHFDQITTPVDTDCCDFQRTLAIANGIKVANCYTATQVAAFMATGAFDLLTGPKYAHTPDYLLAGDIGCMPPREQGHTWIALADGPLAKAHTTMLYVVNSYSLRQRSGPGTEFDTLQCLPRNAAFNVISYTEDSEGEPWAQGEYAGIYGYCSMKYLAPAADLPRLYTNKASWLRATPGVEQDNRLLVIPAMQEFTGTGSTKTVNGRLWYEAIYNEIRGWVSSRYLSVL